jgi:hypothetical protein
MTRILAALVALWCAACGDLPGTGPRITTSHPELVYAFLRAVDVVGDSLERDGFNDPAMVLDVTLLDGPVFQDFDDVMGGQPLWGRNRVVLSGQGVRCEITLALRDTWENVLPSRTSLAHEAAHCSLDWMFEPDPQHRYSNVWGVGGAVARANQALESEGL